MLWEFLLLILYISASYAIITIALRWFWRELPDNKKNKENNS